MKKYLVLLTIALIFNVALAQSFEVLEKSCQGNYVVAKVKETSGIISYRILDFCPYGCMYGTCLAKRELPNIELKASYEAKKCQDLIIFVDIKNDGTRGDVSLSVDGPSWITVPSKISLLPNETKTFAIVASVPCNASGAYPFVLIGSGAINFYSPSVIEVKDSVSYAPLKITTTISPIDAKIALILSIIIIFVAIFWRSREISKKREEKF